MNHICYAPGCRHVVTSARPCPAHPKSKRWDSKQQGDYGAEYKRNRRIVMARDRVCAECGAPAGPGDCCDHEVPLTLGGSHDVSGMRRLCQACHALKTAIEGRDAMLANRARQG